MEAAGALPLIVGVALAACEPACQHSWGHALGRALALLSTHGAQHMHRESAVALCGLSFQLGCYHGAVEGSVLRRLNESLAAVGRTPLPLTMLAAIDAPGMSSLMVKGAAARLAADRTTLCEESRLAGIAYGECVHALGHASFMLSGSNQSVAEALCADFAAAGDVAERASLLYYCVQGVAMEAFYSGRPSLGGMGRAEPMICRASLAPAACFAYWWPLSHLSGGLRTPKGRVAALDFCTRAAGATEQTK